jgi:hypothetical protein
VLSFAIVAIALLLFIAVAFAIGSVFIEPRDAPDPGDQPGPE